MLKYVLGFIGKWKNAKQQLRNEIEEDSAANNWSVYSEVYSSDLDNDEEFNIRLNEIDNGNRLKRKSTIVPDPFIKNANFRQTKINSSQVIRETTTDNVNKFRGQTKLKRK